MKKLELLYTAGRNIKWYNHFGKQSCSSLNIELLYDPETPLLGIYSKEMKTKNAITCTLVFTAASFVTGKKWKQFKCQSTDEWINVEYAYTECLSAIKRNEALTYHTIWMNLENIMLSKRSQSQKTTYYMKCPEKVYLQR